MMYQIFYWVHVVSYIAWLVAFVCSVYLAWKVGKSYRSEEERRFMKMERKATSIGAHLGALGILISGGALASIPGGPKWGWFNFEQYSWLGVKQLLFLIILVLVGFSIKRGIAFKRKLGSDEGTPLEDDTRKSWKNAYSLSLWVYFLVVVNTLLGLTKPF